MSTKDTEAAIWLQDDAAFLYQTARLAQGAGNDTLAKEIQEHAALSAKFARERLGIE